LTGEWILVSPHRSKRPWQGQEEEGSQTNGLAYDPTCYLCPGNTRANGAQNPQYTSTFVFTNDFAAIQEGLPEAQFTNNLLRAETETGICRVVCFSPDHSKSLAKLSVNEIEQVVRLWQSEFGSLGSREEINYVQIFENKGAIMGCSNPHPHGQIWAHRSIPDEILKKDRQQEAFFQKKGSTLLTAYLDLELHAQERLIYENSDFVVLVPFWAIWPYETMLVPKRAQRTLLELTPAEARSFSEAISITTQVYDRLFNTSFPYSSGIHQAPTNGNPSPHWHWHMSFYPPLLRSATVKKFMVGYEMFATPQRDHTPEYAAEVLRKLIP
jgi:UDPglucose--hexose-1-phosphate uridylyltransferase